MKMLVVPSPALSPLSTDEPIPTDGQPEWWRCPLCGDRKRDAIGPGGWCNDCLPLMTHATRDRYNQRVPDGPFPATVAVWQEVWHCGRCKLPKDDPDGCYCGYVTSYPVGAVVATVEVTGKGHTPYLGLSHSRCSAERLCHPDALPDGWHTPTSTVTRLDVPIPMERPGWSGEVVTIDRHPARGLDGGCGNCGTPPTEHHRDGCWTNLDSPSLPPAPFWWADLDLEVPA